MGGHECGFIGGATMRSEEEIRGKLAEMLRKEGTWNDDSELRELAEWCFGTVILKWVLDEE
jgi:hypothetical protein